MDEYLIEAMLDGNISMEYLVEDMGYDNGFKPMEINGKLYKNSRYTMDIKYKGKDVSVTIYYRPELFKFNKYELDKLTKMNVAGITQSVSDKLPSQPELAIFDSEGMRLIWFDKKGKPHITGYYIKKNRV